MFVELGIVVIGAEVVGKRFGGLVPVNVVVLVNIVVKVVPAPGSVPGPHIGGATVSLAVLVVPAHAVDAVVVVGGGGVGIGIGVVVAAVGAVGLELGMEMAAVVAG